MMDDDEKRRRKQIWVTILAIIVVITIMLVVLGLTVFKSRDPDVHINTIDLETFSIGQTSLNMSLLLDITISNPNRASFTYSNGLSKLFYYGDPVGQALIPAGKIMSKADEYLSVLLFVEASRVVMNANLPSNIVSGRLPVVATTTLAGTLKVLGVFKHHAVSTSDCDISIFVTNATVQSFYCSHVVRF